MSKRICDLCDVVDNVTPMHQQVSTIAGIVPLKRHIECCAAAGCTVCIESLAEKAN